MSELTKVEHGLIRRVYEGMWNGHNPSLAHELFANPRGVTSFVVRFLSAFPDLQHTIEEMLMEDQRVAVRFSARGTHRGRWLEFEPTGKSISYTGVTLARIEDGRITSHQTWWDEWGLLRQIRG